MEVITIDSAAYTKIIEKLEAIYLAVKEKNETEKTEINQPPELEILENLYNDSEVCKILKISLRTLQRYRKNGTVSFMRFGGRIRYRLGDIKQFVDKRGIEADTTIFNKKNASTNNV